MSQMHTLGFKSMSPRATSTQLLNPPRDLHYCSGQLNHFHEEIVTNIQPKLPLEQLEAASSGHKMRGKVASGCREDLRVKPWNTLYREIVWRCFDLRPPEVPPAWVSRVPTRLFVFLKREISGDDWGATSVRTNRFIGNIKYPNKTTW